MGRVIGLTAIFITFLGAVAGAQSREEILAVLGYPDTIVHNAKVVTVDDESFTNDVGTIAQARQVASGSLDTNWGLIANEAALAGAVGVAELIRQIDWSQGLQPPPG